MRAVSAAVGIENWGGSPCKVPPPVDIVLVKALHQSR